MPQTRKPEKPNRKPPLPRGEPLKRNRRVKNRPLPPANGSPVPVERSAEESRWPATAVELRHIDALHASLTNPRTHDDVQVGQLANSIKQWGFTIPLLVDETGELIAGEGRWRAAKLLELQRVPVMVAHDWSEAQKRAYLIADNRLAQSSNWDETLLMSEMKALTELDFDVGYLGFNDAELARLTEATAALTDATSEWRSMPQFAVENKLAYKSMWLHFRNDEDIQTFARLVGQTILSTTRFLWFPPEEIQHDDKRYISES
jgi:hypothetical protein